MKYTLTVQADVETDDPQRIRTAVQEFFYDDPEALDVRVRVLSVEPMQ